MNRYCLLIAVVAMGLLLAQPAWPYEEMAVTNGGTISGTVSLKGDKPDAKAYNLVLYPEPAFCGRISTGTGWRLLDQFQVGPDGGLANAVVILEGVKAGKAFEMAPPQIQAKDCIFSPSVVVVRDGDQLGVVNMDPIMHDVQVYEISPSGSRVLLHRPLRLNPYHPRGDSGAADVEVDAHAHLPGERLIDSLKFSKERRVVLVECGFHEYMQTWGLRVENPYFAITDSTGSFNLSDVPPGVYKLVVWHPGMGGILWTDVAILAGETVKTQFEFEAPPTKRTANTTMVENPHYDVNVLGMLGNPVEISPTHEVQEPDDSAGPDPDKGD